MHQERPTPQMVEQLKHGAETCVNMAAHSAPDAEPPVGGFMSATPYSPTRQPVMPSSGGLMGRSFTYRTAEKTDVRLTWERAKAGLAKNKLQA